jgi:hypothetical protein
MQHNIVPVSDSTTFAGDWQPGPPTYRIVLSPKWPKPIDDVPFYSPVRVWTSVAQFTDGTIDTTGRIELPMVHVEISGDDGLTAERTREIAAAMLTACDEIDALER